MLSDLTSEARKQLTDNLTVTASFTLCGLDAEEFPGRMPIYHVMADLSWDTYDEGNVTSEESAAIRRALEELPHHDSDGGVEATVATAELVLLSLLHSDTADAADSSSNYHHHVASTILDADGDGLNEDLADQLGDWGPYALDVAIVEVDERFRGLDIGLRMVARMISHLAPQLAVVALHPFPVRGTENTSAQNAAAHRKLAAYWGRLGFEHYAGEIYWLDPSLVNERLDAYL